MPAISILIVTYNSKETIEACLRSLDGQSWKDFEAVLVDNNSSDGTREAVEEFRKTAGYPLNAIYISENKGFCGANNLALQHASGRYIALLNPDARADRAWLHELMKSMEANVLRSVGICASKILTWNAERIDSAGDVMLTNFRCFKRESDDPGMYNAPEFVFSACAAGALYRRDMIDKIGFFDEDFFIQCDDTDLSFRAQLAGWKVLYVPASKVYHKVSLSIGKASDIGVYYSQRNIEFLRIKNVPLTVLLPYIPQILLGLLADFLYFGVKHMKWRLFIKAKIDAALMLPKMFRKRRRIMKELKTVDNDYVRTLITPLFSRYFISLKFKKIMTPRSQFRRP